MPRASWIDDDNNPALDPLVQKLDHFVTAMADGNVDAAELTRQEQNLLAAMRAVEKDLSDEQHAKVTKLLAELTAYNVMQVLHDLAKARLERAFK